jgi:drug/metabolite transporter (DMT)-like permease
MNQLKLWIVIITLSLTVGSSFIAIKIVLDSIPPLFAFSIRFMITGGVLILVSYIFDRKSQEIKKIKLWRNALIIGAFLILGGHGLIAYGAQYLSAGIASLLNSTIPLWVVLFMFLIFRNKITNLTKIGLTLGFSGMIILVGPSIGGDQGLSLVGIASLLISSLFWALGSIFSSKVSLPQNFLLSAGMITLIGGLLLIIPSILTGELNLLPFSYSDINFNLLISYLFLIFIGTVIPLAEFYWLLKVSTAAVANTFAYMAPIVAVFLGWAILAESVTYLTIIATIVILIGVALIVRTSENSNNK